ncbi:MAG: type II secretion system F family protein [Ruminococcaceae bacterium]|nr:type II secretion system F family protein [Oscillospiraceae bacterium]
MKKLELNYSAYADLFRGLALLMHSGVTVGDGLAILAEDEEDKRLSRLLSDMSVSIEAGQPFYEVLSDSGCFPSHAIGMIEAGERVGKTEETLHSLAAYYESRDRDSKSLRNALIYPSLLLLIMVAIIVILLSKVLPIFDEVYSSFGGSLDGIAGALLSVGNALNFALPFIGIAVGAIVIITALVFLTPAASRAIKGLFLRAFGDRGIMKKMNDSHFAQILSVTLASGLSVEEGIELATGVFADRPGAASRCQKCLELVKNGTELSSALLQARMLSSSACHLLALGTRTGNADLVMDKLASRSADEAQEALTSAISRIEPAIVIITCVMVGIILISVMLPLLNIMKAIG